MAQRMAYRVSTADNPTSSQPPRPKMKIGTPSKTVHDCVVNWCFYLTNGRLFCCDHERLWIRERQLSLEAFIEAQNKDGGAGEMRG